MTSFFNKYFNYIYKLESRIAFYPTLISLVGVFFAFAMFYFENKGVSEYLVEHAPILVVNDTDTARNLLTTFIAGLISIMVFSFSMVMVLLNQASSNFSPRVLPGLISNRKHQVILGIYNASLLYCIFTLVAIEPNGNKYQLPGFSVLLAIVIMTLCLGAFIYFIHSISQEIQVNNIMDRIYRKAKLRLNKEIDTEKDCNTDFPDTSEWTSVKSTDSGYFQDIELETLAEIATTENIKFKVIPVKGGYILKDLPLISSDKDLSDDQIEKIRETFRYDKSELVEDNYVLAFKQITEIAIKAMSPGINDPGTAVNAIDYLTELFSIRLRKNDKSFYFDADNKPLIYVNTVDFNELLYYVMSAFRTYCKHDAVIVIKLFKMLSFLAKTEDVFSEDYIEAIKNETENLYEDAKANNNNEADLKVVESYYKNIRS